MKVRGRRRGQLQLGLTQRQIKTGGGGVGHTCRRHVQAALS